MAPRQIPVLVVGAGPTGLTMALELARRGVVVRLIEQLVEPPSTSRALVVQSRTLELFDDMGVIDAALAAGRPVEGFTQVLRRCRLVQLDFRAQLASEPTLHTTYPRPLIPPQDQTEQILTDHLSKLGVVIERGLTFERLVQREDAVEAELRHHDGRQETVAARWLIGAGVTRIFEVFRGTHHTVLLFAAGSDPRGLLQHATHLEQRHPGLVLARVVCTEPPATSQPRLLHDPHSTLHRAYGADQPTSFVIRPDGHIASRIRPATAPQLTADLDARLGTAPTRLRAPATSETPPTSETPAPPAAIAESGTG